MAMKTKHLNIGCGWLQNASTDTIEWTNLDQFAEVNPDIVCDMTKGIPFDDNYFDYITAIACLGQIEKNKDFLFVMNELWRVLKVSGTLFIYLPHRGYPHAYHDPFNQRRFNEEHWNGFDYRSPQYKHHNSYYGFKPFEILHVETNAAKFLSISMRPVKD